MAAFNEVRYIRQAMDSILAQTLSGFELAIIDDASNDGTGEIVASYKRPEIFYLATPENLGKAKCMNLGLGMARGEYLFEMDGDDWLDAEALQVFVDAMDRMPGDVAMLYGNRRGIVEHPDGSIRQRFLLPGRPYRDRLDFLCNPHPPGPRFYRISSLRETGGWPTDYPSEGRLYEDVALILRLLERFHIRHVDRTVYNMRIHSQNTSQVNLGQWWPTVRPVMEESLRKWGLTCTVDYDSSCNHVLLRPQNESPAP